MAALVDPVPLGVAWPLKRGAGNGTYCWAREVRVLASLGGDPCFAVAALAMMLVFAGVAMGMEAMYQRHLWFVLGLALALPVAAHPPAESKRK